VRLRDLLHHVVEIEGARLLARREFAEVLRNRFWIAESRSKTLHQHIHREQRAQEHNGYRNKEVASRTVDLSPKPNTFSTLLSSSANRVRCAILMAQGAAVRLFPYDRRVYFGGTYGSGAPGLIGGYFPSEARWSSKICPAGYLIQRYLYS
jgi:hypothetical protein